MSTWIAAKFNTNLNHFEELRFSRRNCLKTGPVAASMGDPDASLLQKSAIGALNWYAGGRLDKIGRTGLR